MKSLSSSLWLLNTRMGDAMQLRTATFVDYILGELDIQLSKFLGQIRIGVMK
jgi:hypothetical protein